MSKKRKSGILLHPTSLPGKYGIGTLGDEAFKFVDFLIESGQTLWQILPLNPTGYADCPYSPLSAFAGNPYLIDLETLVSEGYLTTEEISPLYDSIQPSAVDFGKIYTTKFTILRSAYERFKKNMKGAVGAKYHYFIEDNSYWLDDYSLFMAIKIREGKSWFNWDESLKYREPDTLAKVKEELSDEIDFQKFMQYKFFEQWKTLKSYANNNGIKIIGDIPMYVAYDSSDCWANPEVFMMDETLVPTLKAGVPPDYFSATGQLWGNPVFNWEYLKETNFEWWIDRIRINSLTSDILRFDHFRAFSAFWGVPFADPTAQYGSWIKSYGKELFAKSVKEFPNTEMIAEDLGFITPDVEDLRDTFGFKGMKILQFAFDSNDDSDFLPHNYTKNSIVYTGSLDNNTVKGWYDEASEKDREFMIRYTKADSENVSWDIISSAWASVSDYAVTTMQDLFSLGSTSRMNTPGTPSGNWQWRYTSEMITEEIINKLLNITGLYGRR